MADASFVSAPFIFGFEGVTSLYFFVMGGAVILVVLLTDSDTGEEFPED